MVMVADESHYFYILDPIPDFQVMLATMFHVTGQLVPLHACASIRVILHSSRLCNSPQWRGYVVELLNGMFQRLIIGGVHRGDWLEGAVWM